MKIAVISEKGGTGKTMVSSAFIELSKRRVFADCDVDAPNLHLVVSQMSHPIKTELLRFLKSND